MTEADEMMRKAREYAAKRHRDLGSGLASMLADFGKQVEQEVARDCAEIARGNQPDRLHDEGQGAQDYLMGRRMACRAIRSKYGVKS